MRTLVLRRGFTRADRLWQVALVACFSYWVVERKLSERVENQQYALVSSTAAYIDEDLASKKVLLASVAEGAALENHKALMALQHLLAKCHLMLIPVPLRHWAASGAGASTTI